MQPGTSVTHPTLGSGTVQSKNGSQITVVFESGVISTVSEGSLSTMLFS